jgi:hypothetical protein
MTRLGWLPNRVPAEARPALDGRVSCGELTLYPCGGFEVFSTPEADQWLGAFWHLPASGGQADAAKARVRKR